MSDLFIHISFSNCPTSSHDERTKTVQRSGSTARVDGGKSPSVPRVHSVEQDTSLRTSDLTQDDTVRPVTQGCLQQVGEADLVLVRIKLSLGRDYVRFANVQFCGVLDDQDAFVRAEWHRPKH